VCQGICKYSHANICVANTLPTVITLLAAITLLSRSNVIDSDCQLLRHQLLLHQLLRHQLLAAHKLVFKIYAGPIDPLPYQCYP